MKFVNSPFAIFGFALASLLSNSTVSAQMEEGVYIYKTNNHACNGNCDENRVFIDVKRMVQKVVHSVPADIKNKIRSVWFNLPVGYCVRFMNFAPSGTADNWLNHYKSTGWHLIGTGGKETHDWNTIGKHNNKGMAYFVIFEYNPDIGYFELYNADDFRKNVDYFFPEFYHTNKVHSLEPSDLYSEAMSMKWVGLGELIQVELFISKSTPDRQLTISGWTEQSKSIDNLNAYEGVGDDFEAFRWNFVQPVFSEIKSMEIDFPDGIPVGKTYSFTENGINGMNAVTEVFASVSEEVTEEISVTRESTNSFTFGRYTEVIIKVTGRGLIVKVSAEYKFKLEFEVEVSSTETETKSESKTRLVEHSQTIVVPPRSRYETIYVVTMQEIPRTRTELSVINYYRFPIPGSSHVEHESGEFLYRLEATEWVVLGGSFGYDIIFDTSYSSLDC